MEENSSLTIESAIAAPDTPALPTIDPATPLARGPILFYCKACKAIIAAERIGKKYQYKCPACKGKDVAIGTEQSIKSFYRIKA